jgi:hypothetical protein
MKYLIATFRLLKYTMKDRLLEIIRLTYYTWCDDFDWGFYECPLPCLLEGKVETLLFCAMRR